MNTKDFELVKPVELQRLLDCSGPTATKRANENGWAKIVHTDGKVSYRVPKAEAAALRKQLVEAQPDGGLFAADAVALLDQTISRMVGIVEESYKGQLAEKDKVIELQDGQIKTLNYQLEAAHSKLQVIRRPGLMGWLHRVTASTG